MARDYITAPMLADWLTQRLRLDRGCAGCSVVLPIHTLPEPDAEGCNWSDNLTVRLGDNPDADYEAVLKSAVEAARRRFNIRSGPT